MHTYVYFESITFIAFLVLFLSFFFSHLFLSSKHRKHVLFSSKKNPSHTHTFISVVGLSCDLLLLFSRLLFLSLTSAFLTSGMKLKMKMEGKWNSLYLFLLNNTITVSHSFILVVLVLHVYIYFFWSAPFLFHLKCVPFLQLFVP